ncbi:hypothetical protein E8E13_003177 [Curvularia kusanoi]|uniref:Uncharacterized protein n=1 Tax=Curvularia kusanoi TaxID=90978 RepID=A0A9P4W6K3_CURKU|nr:hypothetical protein E8E13_003177 [Curvularia kusanoi]
MPPPTHPTPLIEVNLSISPPSHSFTSPSPPALFITLISHATSPITLVTCHTAFDMRCCLSNSSITITDSDSNTAIQTTRIMVQRAPLRRTRNKTGNENLFLTLQPSIPLILSRPFGRAADAKPQPKSIVQRGWEIDENGREKRIRRSVHATGVDGLEAGHGYRVGLNREVLDRCRWAFATRDEILVEHSGVGSGLEDFPWETGVLGWSVSEAVVAVVE